MPDTPEQIYAKACEHARQTALLGSVESLLNWDERTVMPAAGAEYRAEQMALLSLLAHERLTDARFGAWLDELANTHLAQPAEGDSGTTIRWLKRRHDRAAKLPASLVEELARASVLGQQAWQDARRQDDFCLFQPHLEKMLRLKQQEAEALGYQDSPYDALLDDYEPDARTAHVGEVLSALRDELVPLVAAIRDSSRRPDTSILTRYYPIEEQEALGTLAAQRFGFDFARGRLDTTAHPFCVTAGPHDCRITTRYNPHHFNESFFGILHEAGHGIYEQGLPSEHFGLPLGQAVSLGIHESQSRLWENFVGRSRAFWEYFYPEAQQAFPEALGGVSEDEFHFAVNEVRPSLIRVEADEATYNLHILIRFQLEIALLSGELPVADLPLAWCEQYRKYLGVQPDRDADGVLQDIHWSAGLFGYFPTYALGNLCAAQLFARAEKDLGGLERPIADGQFQPLRDWLRQNVHQHGQRFSAPALIEKVTGEPLSHAPLMQYLRSKLGPLYRFQCPPQ